MINGLKDRLLNISSSAKKIILISASAVVALAVVICSLCILTKQVVIVEGDGSKKEIITFKRYVGEVLESGKIVLGTNDKLSASVNAKLRDGMEIKIYRAFNVTVTEAGVSKNLIATRRTAGEALLELGYNPQKADRITPGYDQPISDFSEITIVRINEKIVEITEEIPYEAQERTNNALASGARKLVQKGAVGEKKVSYKIRYEDGKELSREKLSEQVTIEPIAQIREVGPKPVVNYTLANAGTVQTSRSGSLAYKKVISVNATAYDASSCGKSPSHPAYGITATGRKAGYGIVAVDPSVIPLGSKLYIESADGKYVYGTAIAADTGGAIKGNRIDLCFNTRSEALGFGRRPMKVYVLN